MRAVSALLLLLALAGYTGGDRPDDSNQRPVFYGGFGGSAYSR
jgi:hypothetical protein